MKSNPTSPSSDTSTRSDWFRQSVLFWSSQVDDRHGSQEADNPTTPNRKLWAALSSSQESLSSLQDLTNMTENSYESSQNMELPIEQAHNINETTNDNKKEKTFDPSELLRQVEELENCFRQTPSLEKFANYQEEDRESNKDISPHLTLEFPDGSSIKNNPLFIQAERNYKDQNEKRKLTKTERIDDKDTHSTNDKVQEIDEIKTLYDNRSLDSSLESVKMLLDIVQTAVGNDKLSLDTNSKVVDKEIPLLRTKTVKDVERIQSDESSLLLSPIKNNNKDVNQLFRSKTEINKVSEYQNKSCYTNNTTKEVVDNHNSLTVCETYTKHDETDTQSNKNDKQIIRSIQNVQDTLFEISREINCSHSKEKYTRDPNVVMTDILSNIKPPNDTDSKSQTKHSPNRKLVKNEITTQQESDDMASSRDYHDVMSTNDELFEESKKFHQKSEVLLKQIDQLIDIEHTEVKIKSKLKHPAAVSKSYTKHNPLERLDSGLHSTSSDSTSPYPSPIATRASPTQSSQNIDFEHSRSIKETILEHLKDYNDSVFNDDSDFGSDWSPISTLESVASSTRTRSNSVPRVLYQKNTQLTEGNMSDSSIVQNSNLYSDSELHAIRKFLTLTTRCFDNGKTNRNQGLEELALLPSIKEAMDRQRNELLEQREKQEDFLNQLGDLLLEIVTLKEEHSTVRTKQAKALSLLKKQLDFLKKHQSKAHNDVVDKVKNLNDKLNSSINTTDQLVSLPSSPVASPVLKSHLPSINTSSRNQGQIIWKISDVMKKLTRIKSGLTDGALVSQPFHTNEYGYKMNAWLYLNGRGKSLGKYLSVYVCVLVGEYDAILSWPIRPTYKFTLIDQKSDTAIRHDHVKVRRVLDIAGKRTNVISQKGGIPRPSDGTKALIVGFDDFIAHEQLLERRYLADDVIFLKVEAEGP